MDISYSIIIPHHNCPDLLNRLLASIPAREDLEIIVVDDNSDEGKKPVINRKDVLLIFIDKEYSKGAGRARNVGLDNAHGKWLLFADADDFYADGFLKELDKFKDSTYDIIFFNAFYNYMPKSGAFSNNDRDIFFQSFLTNTSDYQKRTLLKHFTNAPWCRMIRRSFVSNIHARFSETPVCNDAYFSHYTSSKTDNIYAIDKRLYYWVNNPKSLSHRNRVYEIERQRIIEAGKTAKILRKEGVIELMSPFWCSFSSYRRNFGVGAAIKLVLLKLKYGYRRL